ncbi:ACT domain-containing protein [Pseudonocardia lacus]|uniref:ACT domain-containing protein n=1 Tax=Pseudonocardia lacus TaxID=2835865 RepID=UPI001BDDAB86|nr:ACT domain-containing protein [Pseudonocardia lacus]
MREPASEPSTRRGTDLPELLRGLDPHLREGVYVFATVPAGTVLDVAPVATMVEDEGTTVVVAEADARRLGLTAEYRCAWITLRVASSLAAVGMLARVTAALARRGISVNPVAGFHHDHLFVPHERAADAMAALDELRAGSRRIVVGDHEIDDDPTRIDRDVVWRYLSTEAYWGRWRTRADVEFHLDEAFLLLGVYHRGSGEMVGFARGTGDGLSFGYLADVFVLDSARGAGLGKALVEAVVRTDPRIRWVLFTADAHGMYRRYGFAEPDATAMVRPPDAPTGVNPPADVQGPATGP